MTALDRKRLATLFVVVGGVLIAARVLSLAASGPADAQASEAAALPVARAASAALRPSMLRLDRLQERLADAEPEGSAALFAPQAWQAAPPAAPAPALAPAEPAPQVPPFPYAYLGGITEDGRRMAFFASGDRVLALHAGDPVDANFRVDRLDESQMTVTYLPLDRSIPIPFGARR